jgi:hypothetical protein
LIASIKRLGRLIPAIDRIVGKTRIQGGRFRARREHDANILPAQRKCGS